MRTHANALGQKQNQQKNLVPAARVRTCGSLLEAVVCGAKEGEGEFAAAGADDLRERAQDPPRRYLLTQLCEGEF